MLLAILWRALRKWLLWLWVPNLWPRRSEFSSLSVSSQSLSMSASLASLWSSLVDLSQYSLLGGRVEEGPDISIETISHEKPEPHHWADIWWKARNNWLVISLASTTLLPVVLIFPGSELRLRLTNSVDQWRLCPTKSRQQEVRGCNCKSKN